MRDARQGHAGRGVRVGFLHRGDDRARGAIRNPVAQDAGPPFFPTRLAPNPLRLRSAPTREGEMATIKAAVPEKVLSQLRDAADPEETIEETVQGAIQATLPTAEVRYSDHYVRI